MSNGDWKVSMDVLKQTYDALKSCTQPFDCNPECPFYREASFYRVAPLAYCQGRMAGHVSYVLDKMQEVQE